MNFFNTCMMGFFCFVSCSAIHNHYIPVPVCCHVWGHGSWIADDMCGTLSGHQREPPARSEE